MDMRFGSLKRSHLLLLLCRNGLRCSTELTHRMTCLCNLLLFVIHLFLRLSLLCVTDWLSRLYLPRPAVASCSLFEAFPQFDFLTQAAFSCTACLAFSSEFGRPRAYAPHILCIYTHFTLQIRLWSRPRSTSPIASSSCSDVNTLISIAGGKYEHIGDTHQVRELSQLVHNIDWRTRYQN
jgi:hypothetical protein